jgi:hypothetical protein
MIVFSLTSAHEAARANALLFRPHPVLTATLNVLTVRSASALLCWAAGLKAAAVPSGESMDISVLLYVVKAGLLQLGQRADGTGG